MKHSKAEALFLAFMLALVILAIAMVPVCAHADQITADRPGIGIDPETVPQWTLQPEMGTDSQEVRLGLLKGLEADWQGDQGDTAEGIKLAVMDSAKVKSSIRLAYDQQLHGVVEVPVDVQGPSWFSLGIDAMISRTSQVYSAAFNFAPTGRLTISPTIYHDDKPRAAIFIAWVPPGHDNVQFDAGYDQGKISVGISTAISFARKH